MFGLSWGQIVIILLVGVFLLGPERIPTAVTWVLTSLRKLRTMAAGAQAELRREIGPEIEELRRQVADLQSLKEIQELRDLRDLHPKRLIGRNILGEEFAGGISGFLGLTEPQNGSGGAAGASGAAMGTGSGTPAAVDAGQADSGPAASGAQPARPMPAGTPASAVPGARPPHRPPSMTTLAAPKVVGSAVTRAATRVPASGERPPFDPDGT